MKSDLKFYSKDVEARLSRTLKYAIDKYERVAEDAYGFVVDYPTRWKGPDIIAPANTAKVVKERNGDSDAATAASKLAIEKEIRFACFCIFSR